MQVERVIAGVKTLGPGQRICIWTNGCPRRCEGCVSPELQSAKPENECDIISVVGKFDLSAFDGVTVSGGEPFEQAAELAALVRFLRGKGVADILVYTGYTVEELERRAESGEGDIRYLLEHIGVLIDGPYMREYDDGTGNLFGSKNQRVIFINESLRAKYDAYASDVRTMQEFFMFPHIVGVGIPTEEYIKKFR